MEQKGHISPVFYLYKRGERLALWLALMAVFSWRLLQSARAEGERRFLSSAQEGPAGACKCLGRLRRHSSWRTCS